MNELNTLETRLDNLLDQYEAINIDINDMGIKELSQMMESFDSVKDAAWNYDESHSELSDEERVIIDRITDTVYERVSVINRVLEEKNSRYLEDGRENIEIRRELREIQKRIEKNEAIVNIQRGPELENSESFMKLYNESLAELESDKARVEQLNSRKAELYRTMRDLQYGGSHEAKTLENHEEVKEEVKHDIPEPEVKPEISTEEEKHEEIVEPLPEPIVPETTHEEAEELPEELPEKLDTPSETVAPVVAPEVPEELPEELPSEENDKKLEGPIPVVAPNGEEAEELPEELPTKEETEELPEELPTEEPEEEKEEEDEVVAVVNPKPNLWKKIGDVLKKAAVFIVALATLGTAYHTGHIDHDIHKLNDTTSSISDTLTEMSEREDLDLDEDEEKDKDNDEEKDEEKDNTMNNGNGGYNPGNNTPSTPSTPEPTPVTPEPVTPVTPVTPAEPSTPSKPSTPSTPSEPSTPSGSDVIGTLEGKEVIVDNLTGNNINADGELFDKDGNKIGSSDLNKDLNGDSLVKSDDLVPDRGVTPIVPPVEPPVEKEYHNDELTEEQNEDLNNAFDDANLWSIFDDTDALNNATTDSYTRGM